jgi:2,4-dienoyl-CoA reductase-like NADH-dependent reductase (Old Yellow Enzyme family)
MAGLSGFHFPVMAGILWYGSLMKAAKGVLMGRDHYTLFSEGRIGKLRLSNRLVRSATWDPIILNRREMVPEVLAIYRDLAAGGVGLIITGGLDVYSQAEPGSSAPPGKTHTYPDLRVSGIEQLAETVHAESRDCKVIAQLEAGYVDAGPSDYPSPYRSEPLRELSVGEIHQVVAAFVAGIVDMKEAGFDGVQLHAAHGGLLSTFLSPYTNRREDGYGGSAQNRVRVIRDIVEASRAEVGDFPIIIKLNGTDYLPGGIDADNLPALVEAVVDAGIEAVEVSGGMWECLARPQSELGFRPAPSPESHTRIKSPGKQSYFLKYACQLEIPVPVILVGGNRDVERLEEILSQGHADFIAMSRPLIREPDLPNRWREGRGDQLATCVSCNSCLFEMYTHPGREEPGIVRCVCSQDRELHQQAQKWLAGWVRENIPGS